MINNVDLEKVCKIKDFNNFKYDYFIEKSVDLFIRTNLTKKSFRNLKLQLMKESFYPIHIVKVNENETKDSQYNKLEQLKNNDKEIFKERYYSLVEEQFRVSDRNHLFDIIFLNIKSCPFCKGEKFSISHDYSLSSKSGVSIYLSCDKCKEELIKKIYFFSTDVSWQEYNKKLAEYLDKYVKDYPNKVLFREIKKEVQNMKVFSFID